MKKVLIGIGILSVIIIAVCAVTYYVMSRPAYTPGILSGRSDLKKFTTPPSQKGVKDGYLKVDDKTELYYFKKGEGEPVLVIHGGPGFPTMKEWNALGLVKGCSFYYYHQRGCGYSTRPFDKFESGNYYKNMTDLIGSLGMEQQLADIERIRKILGVEKITIIGHSYGGYLATMYATEFPKHVKKMILVSPAGVLKLPADNDGMAIVKKYLSGKSKKDFDKFLNEYFAYGSIFEKDERQLAELNAEYGKFYTEAAKNKGFEVPAEIVKDSGKISLVGGWMVHGIYLSLGSTYDHRDAVKKITAPTLVIYGKEDVYPPSISEEYARLIPNARFVSINDAGHFPFIEQPARFATLVNQFLQ